MLIDGAHDPLNTTASMSVSECCGASLSVTQSLAAFPASVAAKRLLIDCFQERPVHRGPVVSVSVCVCLSSEVAGLGSLVQRPQLLKARPPVPERLLSPALPSSSSSPISAARPVEPC